MIIKNNIINFSDQFIILVYLIISLFNLLFCNTFMTLKQKKHEIILCCIIYVYFFIFHIFYQLYNND